MRWNMKNIKTVNKISIIGGSGTGKSTLARNLSKELNIEFYHIDAIHHLENWKIRDKEERDSIIYDIVSKDKWIIDGTYKDTLVKRMEEADIIIYLDYSTIARVKGILTRYLKSKGKERPDIPGCKERMNFNFLKFVVTWKKKKRKQINENIKYVQENNKKSENNFLIFKNRKKLNKWYKNEFNKKIETMIKYL